MSQSLASALARAGLVSAQDAAEEEERRRRKSRKEAEKSLRSIEGKALEDLLQAEREDRHLKAAAAHKPGASRDQGSREFLRRFKTPTP